jgi:hypothetical protein
MPTLKSKTVNKSTVPARNMYNYWKNMYKLSQNNFTVAERFRNRTLSYI